MSKHKPPANFDENPEWTARTTARPRRAGKLLPPHAAEALVKRPPGRPKGATSSKKTQVTLRLDSDVVDRFRATGPDWQSRINECLKAAKVQ